ncbi:MAG: hypothetical protein G01um101413_865 [Parcubacteria group bacterium Gr01-1014_13]|nr:MAG: hypothetical protein G01um101413_865 [Parcubacteria group bacterium Gr01-1014_13]
MGIFAFFKQLANGRVPKDPQKQLPGPDIIKCGLCQSHIDMSCLFVHWLSHMGVRYIAEARVINDDGVLRVPPAVRNVTFIIRRPVYREIPKRFDLELLTADYFAFAIAVLKKENPHMRFQYVNAVMGDTGEYLKTLLVIGEWYE